MSGFSHQKQRRLLRRCSKARTNRSTQSLTGDAASHGVSAGKLKHRRALKRGESVGVHARRGSPEGQKAAGLPASQAGEKLEFVITSPHQSGWLGLFFWSGFKLSVHAVKEQARCSSREHPTLQRNPLAKPSRSL